MENGKRKGIIGAESERIIFFSEETEIETGCKDR